MGHLVNLGLLERELGSVEYRLSKLAAGATGRPDLEAQKAQLLRAIDREMDRTGNPDRPPDRTPGDP